MRVLVCLARGLSPLSVVARALFSRATRSRREMEAPSLHSATVISKLANLDYRAANLFKVPRETSMLRLRTSIKGCEPSSLRLRAFIARSANLDPAPNEVHRLPPAREVSPVDCLLCGRCHPPGAKSSLPQAKSYSRAGEAGPCEKAAEGAKVVRPERRTFEFSYLRAHRTRCRPTRAGLRA